MFWNFCQTNKNGNNNNNNNNETVDESIFNVTGFEDGANMKISGFSTKTKLLNSTLSLTI